MIQYKGYIAQVEYNVPTGRFLGRVINARGAITFGAQDRADLKEALRHCVDAYLACCPEQDGPAAPLMRAG